VKPEIDESPTAIASGFWTLASLIEAWDASRMEGAPLTAAVIQEALEPIYVEPEGEEARGLADLEPNVKALLAESVYKTVRELRKFLQEEDADGPKGEAVDRARVRLCGSLKIVHKLRKGEMPGFLADIWTLHDCS